jgi:predicted RNA-binding protein with PUA-like domain
MAFWIMKTEPESYSFERLVREKKAVWDGVTNPVALSNMRAMRAGDTVMIYHTGDQKSCVGLAEVVKEAYLDPNDSTGKLVVVEIEARQALRNPVTLAQVRAEPSLAELALVRMPRLSVLPATDAQWKTLIAMSNGK